MFVVDLEPKFTHEVKVRVPVDGGFVDQTFNATYRVLPTDVSATFDMTNGTEVLEFLQRVVVSFDDLIDANKKTVEYSNELRDQLLKVNYVRQAVVNTYFNAISGARSGN